jgi:hypothetical protein
MARRFIYFDLETTDFGSNAEILQIGAIGSQRLLKIIRFSNILNLFLVYFVMSNVPFT